jgi:hypothetical protein
LEGEVTVNQFGGYKDGRLYMPDPHETSFIENSDQDKNYPLQPGQTYLFATRYLPQENWHTLNSFPTARKLISGQNSLTDEALAALAENDERFSKWREAYVNEITLDADVKTNNVRNSFSALPFEEQQKLKNEINAKKSQ